MERLINFKDKFIEKLNSNKLVQKLKAYWEKALINKILILVIFGWIILAIIFGFADLAITRAVIDNDSKLGQFGAVFGEAPGYALVAIALVIVIGSAIGNKTGVVEKQRYIAFVIIILAMILFIVGLAIEEYELALYGGAVGFPLIFFVLFTLEKDWNDYKLMAVIIVLLLLIVPLGYVQITKLIWGRVRPNDVLAGNGYFTPWAIPNGYTGNASMPSGHTSMGWMFLPLLILVSDKEKVTRSDTNIIGALILIMGVIFWGVFVGASRVIVGAHFASDVLFSTGTAAITTIILYKFVYLRQERPDRFARPKHEKVKKEKQPKVKTEKIKKPKYETTQQVPTESAFEKSLKETDFPDEPETPEKTKKEEWKKIFKDYDDEFPLE